MRVGEPFEVVFGYSYVLPSISYDDSGSEFLNYDEPERQCPETWCGDYRTRVEMSSNVDLRDEPDYVFYTYGTNTDYTPHRTYEIGHVMPPYNNTTPQQKTLTFVINEPTINYDFGIIYMSHGNGNNGLIHFYVGPYGIVRLSDEPITVLREGVPQLVPNLPEPTKKVLPEDPLTGVDDPEKLMHDLAEWMREAYLPDWIDQIEPDLRESNFPDWFIEKLFKLYPDLKAQAFTTPVWFILPSAHAQQSPSSFVYGTAYYYDLDGNKVLLANTEILL